MADMAHQFLGDMLHYAHLSHELLTYAPTRLYQMLQEKGEQYGAEQGAVETARALIKKPNSSGLADLALHGEDGLKISVEWLVVQPQYASMFTSGERILARKTLTDNGLSPQLLPPGATTEELC